MTVLEHRPSLGWTCSAILVDPPLYQIYSQFMSTSSQDSTRETRNARFKRLAEARGDRLIREISLLGNLANRKNYDYTPEQVGQLFEPIERELREIRALFDPSAPSTRKVNFK